jgi:hypothetical protein
MLRCPVAAACRALKFRRQSIHHQRLPNYFPPAEDRYLPNVLHSASFDTSFPPADQRVQAGHYNTLPLGATAILLRCPLPPFHVPWRARVCSIHSPGNFRPNVCRAVSSRIPLQGTALAQSRMSRFVVGHQIFFHHSSLIAAVLRSIQCFTLVRSDELVGSCIPAAKSSFTSRRRMLATHAGALLGGARLLGRVWGCAAG